MNNVKRAEEIVDAARKEHGPGNWPRGLDMASAQHVSQHHPDATVRLYASNRYASLQRAKYDDQTHEAAARYANRAPEQQTGDEQTCR
jgi:hypothetical protein